ncbi:MAG: ABC transporter substrate-binding protein, partial [Oscillospiraceae bacterium]|nr:ABC transporter substrate-binding protein [Oscillospiraceae bacterium]
VTINIFDSLLAMIDGELQPALAERWEQIDEVTWRFFLREDVYFHDGVQMTADDVAFSIERSRDAPRVQFISGFVSHAELVDDFTVDVVTVHPFAPTLANLAMPMMAIVPRHLVEADEDHFIENPVGTGPYRFTEWRRGQGASLVANEDYFRGAPLTRYLEMRQVKKATQRSNDIETEEAHLAYDLISNDAARVQGNPDLVFYEGDPIASWFLFFNVNRPPMDDVRVRQAIRYAINQDDIIQVARHGLAIPADSFIPPMAFGHSTQTTHYAFNPERSRELMEEAGLSNLTLTLYVNEAQERIDTCQVIQAQLLQIGISVEIIVLEMSTFQEVVANGEHDMALITWTIPTLDADYNFFSLLHSRSHGTAGNRSFWADSETDRLIEAGRSLTDRAERQAVYDELAAHLGPLSPHAYLFWTGIDVGASNRVHGFNIEPNGYHRLFTVWID